MKKLTLLSTFLLLALFSDSLLAQANFETSLHKTRNGKPFWYSEANGGFEGLTNVPITELGCVECHGPSDANGNPYSDTYSGGICVDCHATDFSVAVDQCYKCHGRQKTETVALALPDVHRDAGMVCWDCHGMDDLHGDGTAYNSMLEDGAIKTDCSNEGCHPSLPEGHEPYDPHGGKLHCSSCHSKTVISCYNCHFESQVETHLKRAYKPINDFVLLVNREKDGKVYPASFQSLSYQDTSFVAFGPFGTHTITREGKKCADCHANDVVKEYDQTGEIKFAEWNEADSALTWKHGIVPIPYDYESSFKMDFITYTGSTADPVAPSKQWAKIGKDTWDGGHMLFATPLTEEQMDKLSMDVGAIAENFETSIHKTRAGKNYWYGKENGGFEAFTNVPVSEIGCVECHGPTDANGNPYPVPYPGASCVDCHADDGTVSMNQCFSCHSRQKTEAVGMAIPDVHRDAGFVCWDCHGTEDMHGDGTPYNSMLEDGATKTDCSNEGCHASLPASHPADTHGGKLHCTSCHSETVITCYNCHFESQVETQVKRAYKQLTGFVILVNREKDGKVHPASFQSLTYQGNSFAAIGPYTSHTIKKEARGCADCHVNFGGQVESIIEYNNTGEIKFAEWNEADSALTWKKGIVPLPADYQRSFKMDFITYDGSTADAPGTGPKNWSKIGKDTWDGHQLFFASPMTKDQMAKLGFDTTLTDVRQDGVIPTQFSLEQNYPNPFNPSTTIQYSLAKQSQVSLKVYDVIGNEVTTLIDETQNAGTYRLNFNAANLASGIYFYQLNTDSFTDTKKLVLLK